MKELLWHRLREKTALLILGAALFSPFVIAKPIDTPNFSNNGQVTEDSTLDRIIDSSDEEINGPDERTNISEERKEFVSGDIIAHTSKSRQSEIIRSVRNDVYTHIGIIVERNDRKYVLEAVEPVKYTPFEEWVNRGIDKKYTVKRLPEDYNQYIPAIISEAERHLNKHYDILFDPSDRKMYCSELVAKAIKRGSGLQVGKWSAFSSLVDFNTLNPRAKKEIKRRWGTFPKDIKVITPESIMDSGILKEIYSNY